MVACIAKATYVACGNVDDHDAKDEQENSNSGTAEGRVSFIRRKRQSGQ